MTPSGGSTVGVGQLIKIRFAQPIRYRAAAERTLKVTGSVRLPSGTWAWTDNRTVLFRPVTWWPAHARIKVTMQLRGVILDRRNGKEYVGSSALSRAWTFNTGRAVIAYIDDRSHRMTVRIDGKVARRMGVSLGKAGFLTRSGVKILTGEKYEVRRMTSQQLGLTNETYDLQVPYAVRLTPTGEFVHGAPWAAARIGRYDGSHGCTNLQVADATWFYQNIRRGDVVVTVGTGRAMEPTNGANAEWNYTASQWRAKSALTHTAPAKKKI